MDNKALLAFTVFSVVTAILMILTVPIVGRSANKFAKAANTFVKEQKIDYEDVVIRDNDSNVVHEYAIVDTYEYKKVRENVK